MIINFEEGRLARSSEALKSRIKVSSAALKSGRLSPISGSTAITWEKLPGESLGRAYSVPITSWIFHDFIFFI
jgi:hypothetical protein